VVSHEVILQKAWPNVVVAPNALQRCITQLRKAFDDDTKRQLVIATHPKVGYSLVAPVTYPPALHEAQADAPSNQLPTQQSTIKPSHKYVAVTATAVTAVLALLLAASSFYGWRSTQNTAHITRVTPLTATDNIEFYPRFSPNGRYVSFVRNNGHCKNRVWLKDLESNSEHLLTTDFSQYGRPSWSPDGSQLVFTASPECSDKRPIERCQEIRRLNVTLSITNPQESQLLLSCTKNSYSDVDWLSNTAIAFIEKNTKGDQVSRLQLDSGVTSSLYQAKGKNLHRLAYSATRDVLAITQDQDKGVNSLVLINPTDKQYSEIPLTLPQHLTDFKWWIPSWHPSGNSLLASAHNTLYDIQLDGSIRSHTAPVIESIHTPMYHPDGKRIVASMGILDIDVDEFSWSSLEKTSPQSKKNKTVDRSTRLEVSTKYQPNGEATAFISMRGGSEQIWLKESGQLRQLSQLKEAARISFDWSNDGKLIALVAQDHLHLIQLNGQMQTISTDCNVQELFQWVGKQKLLISIIDNNTRKIILFDIHSNEVKTLYTGNASWVQVGDDNSLYLSEKDDSKGYNTDKNTLYHIYNAKKHPLPLTQELHIKGKFIYHKQHILLSDTDKSIWLVDIEQDAKQKLYTPTKDENIHEVEDLDLIHKRLLFSKFASARKEIVIFE
jgi:Tol biopolymer transport system component